MQLAKSLAGHFASHHSPLREKRELWFAATGNNSKDQQDGKTPEVAETVDATNTTPPVNLEDISQSVSVNAMAAAGIEKSLPESVLRSDAIRTAVLSTDVSDREKKENPALSDVRKGLDAYARKHEAYLADMTNENIIAEMDRTADMLLRTPIVAMRAIRSIESQIKRYDTAIRNLSKADGSEVKLIERHLSGDMQATLELDRLRDGNNADQNQRLSNIVNWLNAKRVTSGYVQKELAKGSKDPEDILERKGIEEMNKAAQVLRSTLAQRLQARKQQTSRRILSSYAKASGLEYREMEKLAPLLSKLSTAFSKGNRQDIDAITQDPAFANLDEQEKTLMQKQGISLWAMALRWHEESEEIEKISTLNHRAPEFLDNAENAFERLEELSTTSAPDVLRDTLTNEQREVEEWAVKTVEKIDAALSKHQYQDSEEVTVLQRARSKIAQYKNVTGNDILLFRQNGPLAEKNACVTPLSCPKAYRRDLDVMLLRMNEPRLNKIYKETDKEIRESLASMPKAQEQLFSVIKETRGNLEKIIPDLVKITDHPATKALGIQAQLQLEERNCMFQMDELQSRFRGKTPSSADIESAMHDALRIQNTVKRMKWAQDEIANIFDPKNIEKNPALPDDVNGYYDEAKKRIVINAAKLSNLESIMAHEKGHALIHVFTRVTGLFPLIVNEKIRELRQQSAEGGDKEEFDRLFNALRDKKDYKYIQNAAREGKCPPDEVDEAVMDELLNRYTEWTTKDRNNDGFADEEVRLFKLIEENPHAQRSLNDRGFELAALGNPEAKNKDMLEARDFKKYNTDGDTSEGEEGSPEVIGKIYNMREDLTEVGRMVQNIRNFTQVKEYQEKYPEFIEQLKHPHLDDIDAWYTYFQDSFNEASLHPELQKPEENKVMEDQMKKLREHCDILQKKVRQVDIAELDTTSAPAKSMGLGIRFLSINDMMKFFKDSWEDLNSQWTRAQDRRLKEFGDVVTGALRNVKTPFGSVNKYANGMFAYHKRRYSGTETEAANKWKDGMENEDSHTLLHYLHETKNKDAIRGIISLLCHRGEMEWTDVGVWKTFNKLSRYQMPIEACKRDEYLRDTWLRKLATDIWDDREIYYHWKQENDGAIQSGKKKFTDTADQLSNLSGAMKAELSKQLSMHVEAHEKHELPPQDVKPHLYEEVLEYAIRNGKMSMEDKFYYLVMGIHHGILGVERLRVLAGEKGEILMKFPFIDYFYQKNNSIDEIHAIAARLQESASDKKFQPGLRTTMFLYYDVARSDSVRARVSKALSRVAEGIDHEDIPFLISQIDWNAANNLAAVISGSRQKVTVEGWKNSYVGFNTFMKVYGDLVALDDAGLDRFTKTDAQAVARTLTTYIFTDNILTKNGTDKPDDAAARPSLAKEQLDTMCPSGGSVRTNQWRRQMNGFVTDLLGPGGLGPYFEGHLGTYKEGNNTRNVTLAQFAPIFTGEATEYDRGHNKELKTAVFNATSKFSERLRDLLANNPGAFEKLKEILRTRTKQLHYESAAPNSRPQIAHIMKEWNKTSGYKGNK